MSSEKIRLSISYEVFDILWEAYSSLPPNEIDKDDYQYLFMLNVKRQNGMLTPAFTITHAKAKKRQAELAKYGFDSGEKIAESDPGKSAYLRWCDNPLLLSEAQLKLSDDYRANAGLMTEEELDRWQYNLTIALEANHPEAKEKYEAKMRKDFN